VQRLLVFQFVLIVDQGVFWFNVLLLILEFYSLYLEKMLEMVSLGLLTRMKSNKHVGQRMSNLRC